VTPCKLMEPSSARSKCCPQSKSSGSFLLLRSLNELEISPSPSTVGALLIHFKQIPLVAVFEHRAKTYMHRAQDPAQLAPEAPVKESSEKSFRQGKGGASRPNASRTCSTERVHGGQVEWRNPGRAITARQGEQKEHGNCNSRCTYTNTYSRSAIP